MCYNKKMNKSAIFFSGALLAALLVVVAPQTVSAQTVSYQPRTQDELMAYLYGRITMLLEIKAVLERNGSLSEDDIDRLGSYVEFETKGAADITRDGATLRGEVVLYGDMTATVWFEFGQDEDFLDLRSNRVGVKSAYDRAVRVGVGRLEEDERYYYRMVLEDKDGHIRYGNIRVFRTDEGE